MIARALDVAGLVLFTLGVAAGFYLVHPLLALATGLGLSGVSCLLLSRAYEDEVAP